MDQKISVLIVDDSAFMRKMISKLLSEDPGLEVVGTARDGMEAIRKLDELNPDVVTLDVEMPKMDGLQTLGYIMSESPRPCIMLSAYTPKGADLTLKALEYGAVDFVQKPSGSISLNLERVREELIEKVKIAPGINLKRVPFVEYAATAPGLKSPDGFEAARENPESSHRVVAIGCSTGGPRALSEVIPRLPKDFPAPVLIVQHMSPGFTRSLAQRLDTASQLRVKEAEDGEKILPGTVYLAPGDWHMEAASGAETPVIRLHQRPPMLGVRPSADLMFLSTAAVYGKGCLGVVLTGMGRDGSKGLAAVKKQKGKVLAQDEGSCVVYGMPRAARESGVVDEVVPLDHMAEKIIARFP